METRIVFMGSPQFALPTLKALATNYNVVGVVTQPDRPAGRGRGLTAPAVKELAVELGLSVIQPIRLKEPQAMEQLQHWEPQLVVVAAFGQILHPEALDLRMDDLDRYLLGNNTWLGWLRSRVAPRQGD